MLRTDLISRPREGLNFRQILKGTDIAFGIVATIASVAVLVASQQQTADERVPIKTLPLSVAPRASAESSVPLPATVDNRSANAGVSLPQAQNQPADASKADQPPSQMLATGQENLQPATVSAPPVPAADLQTQPADVSNADQPPSQVIAAGRENPQPATVSPPPVPAGNLPQTQPPDLSHADLPPSQVIATGQENLQPATATAPPVPAANPPQRRPTH